MKEKLFILVLHHASSESVGLIWDVLLKTLKSDLENAPSSLKDGSLGETLAILAICLSLRNGSKLNGKLLFSKKNNK